MQLAKSSAVSSRAVTTRRPVVRVLAAHNEGGLFAGLLRIFTPATYLQTKDSFPENSGYTGTVPRGRRPFKDGYSSAPVRTKPGSAAPQGGAAAAAAAEGDSALGYLTDAAQRVVSNNFTGDETEPNWEQMGGQGWNGQRRSKQADGFHSIKM